MASAICTRAAAEIARNFRPFMSRYGRIIDIKQTNTIIIADTGSNINRLAKMVKFLDVAGHEEALQIVRVKNSSAQEIAKLLDSILKGGTPTQGARPGSATPRFSSSGSGSDSTSTISRIIAEPRTNSIIAMANAEGAKQLRELIQMFQDQIPDLPDDPAPFGGSHFPPWSLIEGPARRRHPD